jgi:hypothetical protein
VVAESEAGSGLERPASRCRWICQFIFNLGAEECTWIALLISSGRLEAAAAACDAFLFKMPLEGGVTLLDFRVAATRFADIRSAISKELYVTIGAVKRKQERKRDV